MKLCKELKKARDEKIKQYKKILKKINGMPIDDEMKRDVGRFIFDYLKEHGGLK